MSAGVLVVVIDAMELTLIDRWAAEGDLPTLARLGREACTATIRNRVDELPGALYPELTSGVTVAQRPFFYAPSQIHAGETVPRSVGWEEFDPDRLFWTVAGLAGQRIAAIDLTHTVTFPGLDGVQLVEWGTHDRLFEMRSEPYAFADDIRARYGEFPVGDCDLAGPTIEGYRRFLNGLLDGSAAKARALTDLLGREHWDLFVCGFGEPHCIGHQFWHFLDETSPAHPPDAPDDLRDAIRSVYRRIDETIGALLEVAGPDAHVLVLTSHGMGPIIGGPQLLEDVLQRMGTAGGAAGVRGRIPRSVRTLAKRFFPTRLRERLRQASLETGSTRAVPVKNNRIGAIRLNLFGREPAGSVHPGAEAELLLDEITETLLGLRHIPSGEPAVDAVIRVDERFGPDRSPDLPDLLVQFRQDLGPIEVCESDRVGRVEVPVHPYQHHRTGDHTAHSRLWATGPGVSAADLGEIDALDLAPTVLSLLGVEPPPSYAGRAVALGATTTPDS